MVNSPELIASIELFSGLDEFVISRLYECYRVTKRNAGDMLYYERESDESLHYIINGSVKFYKVDRYDNEIFLYQCGSDTLIFDIEKMCESGCFICFSNAEFSLDSIVLSFDAVAFKQIMSASSQLMQRILKESFKTISSLQCVINRDVVFDGAAKVAHMIATELNTFNSLKKHEIAYMLHIQPETPSRILKKLARNELMSMDKNMVVIQNLEELTKI